MRTTLRTQRPSTTILWKPEARRCLGEIRGLRCLRRVGIKLSSWRTVFSPLIAARLESIKSRAEVTTNAAFQWTTVHIITGELADRHCSVLMGIHFDKRKATIGLKSCFDDEAEVLEKRHKIILCCIWSKITDVASSLPLWSLLNNHLVALDAVGREVVMATERRCRGHAHGCHSLLLRN